MTFPASTAAILRKALPFAALLPLLVLCACATIPANDPAPPISLSTMQETVRTLSSDEFEGREPGTQGEELTIAYLAQQFAAAGLQPGNHGSWLQDVPLVEIEASNYAPLTIDGQSFAQGSDWVGVSYRQVPHTEIADSPVVFVGFGINAPERGWNDYAGVDMRGKTALILVNDPDYADEGLEGTFNGRAMTYYGRWTYKFDEAARQGAVAAIIIHADFPASYGWNVVESSWTGSQAYTDTGDGGMGATLMNGWVTNDTARAIFGEAGMDMDQLVAAAARPGFRAMDLGVTASASFDNAFRNFTSHNVIGVLPGTTRADEYVLHTAHWDHLGHCTPNAAGDGICNGAIDNGTGTAALVTLAQAHAAAGPTARSQVFLAVTAEESGLLGSEYYGANPIFPLDHTVGGLNMDSLYIFGAARDVTVMGGGKSELDGYLARALAVQGRSQTPDHTPEAGRYYRSDHFNLARRGVPMLYLKAGEDLLEGGLAAGQAAYQDYNSNRYHGPEDEYDPAWDWSGVMQDLELNFLIGRALGDSSEWPNWNAGDEFRATRDALCAAPGGC